MSDKNHEALKSGWRRVKFGNVVRQCKEKAYPETSGLERYIAGDHMDTDDLRLRRWGEIGSGYLGPAFHMRFKPGQVLYGSRRTYLRKVAVSDFDGICANTTFVLESKSPEELLSEFLPVLMQTDAFNEFSVKNSKGSVNPYINYSDLARFEFSLPPIEEQTRIVKVLQAAREVNKSQSDALAQLEILRKSTIDQLLILSDERPSVRLEKIVTMQNGRPFPGEEYVDQGIKLLRPGNLGASGYLLWSDKTVCLDPSWEAIAVNFVVQPGDVVINLTAQSLDDGFMGRVCLVKEQDRSLLNQRIGRFRCNEHVLLPKYLFRCLQTSRFRQHAHSNCEGSKVKHMFWQHLAKYEIPVPNIDIQEDVIAQCADIDQAIDALTSRLTYSKQLAVDLTNRLAGGA